jgi:hypothetical protein
MANMHKHPPAQVRSIPRPEVEAFDRAAAEVESNRSAITRALWAWFAGEPGAALPQRPADRPTP